MAVIDIYVIYVYTSIYIYMLIFIYCNQRITHEYIQHIYIYQNNSMCKTILSVKQMYKQF